MQSGIIFAIKRYAIHDGPNIRTTVFLKGCPLRCTWCHNPEGINRNVSVISDFTKCVTCGECVSTCPTGSLQRVNGRISKQPTKCSLCQNCTTTCPAVVHEPTGWQISVAELMGEICRDLPFFDGSQGGVTFSGGEPLMQAEFLLETLKACGEIGIHRVVDTCAYAATELLLQVAKQTDLFLLDLKVVDSSLHQHYTGKKNELILHNIKALARNGSALRLRIPLVDGVNNDVHSLRKCGAFIKTLPGVEEVDLLPFHAIAATKYTKLGLVNPSAQLRSIAPSEVEKASNVLLEMGIKVRVGG